MGVAGRPAAGLDAMWAASDRIGILRSGSFVITGPKAPPPGRGGGEAAVRGEGRLEAVQKSPDLFRLELVDLASFCR